MKVVLFNGSRREKGCTYTGLCRAKLYTCARLAKNPQSVSPSKTVFRLHDRCFYAEMTVRRFAAFSQFRSQSTAWPDRAGGFFVNCHYLSLH